MKAEPEELSADKQLRDIKRDQTCCNRLLYGFFKLLRIMYCAVFYYFMPFAIILLPLLSEYTQYGVTERTQTIVETNFDEFAHNDTLDHAQFTSFIVKTVCTSSVKNEAVLRDEDLINH